MEEDEQWELVQQTHQEDEIPNQDGDTSIGAKKRAKAGHSATLLALIFKAEILCTVHLLRKLFHQCDIAEVK